MGSDTVIISGWKVGLQKVSMTLAVREHCGTGLRAAKSVTDRVLDGDLVTLRLADEQRAKAFVFALDKLGAVAAIAAL